MAKRNPKAEVKELKDIGKTGRDTKYSYILDWIQEANDARRGQNALVERAILAYQGLPQKNTYIQNLQALSKRVFHDDKERAAAVDACVKALDGKRNMTVHNAVETLVSMSMGGVGQYEFGPYDPNAKAEDKLYDRLASAAKHFYDTNKMDSVFPQYIRGAVLRGASHLHIKQGKSEGKKKVTLLTSDQMLTDPKRFKTNTPRFIGFSQRESFKAIKNRTTKTKGGYMLKTLNDAKVYVDTIVNELNGVNSPNQASAALHDTIRRDVDIFYKPILTSINQTRTTPVDKGGNPDYMYSGDEVEIIYMYDLQNDMYFEVINRKYIIVAKNNDLKRNIKYKFIDSKGKEREGTKKVHLDHPFVELPTIITEWDTYPVTPLFYVLDEFDQLCAMETLLDHTLSIMGPLTFQGQSSDAEKVAQIASVSGEIIEGVAATFGVLNKTHDITPIVTGITRAEEKIKRVMKAVDPFELQAMIGDRASAKEVASASGQVAQGINPFIANIETAAAELGDKFIKLEIIFGEEKYSFNHNGKYDELTLDEMAADCEIRAKLMTSIKLEQAQNARAAIELIGVLGANEAIDKKEFLGTMIPIAMSSLVGREQAKKMVLPAYRPMPEEVIAQIEERAKKEAEKSPFEKLDLNYDDATLDVMMRELATNGNILPQQMPIDPMMAGQPPIDMGGQMPVDQAAMPEQPPVGAVGEIPLTPETGGEYQNDPMLGGMM